MVRMVIMLTAALALLGCEKKQSKGEEPAPGAARATEARGQSSPEPKKPAVKADASVELRVLGMT